MIVPLCPVFLTSLAQSGQNKEYCFHQTVEASQERDGDQRHDRNTFDFE